MTEVDGVCWTAWELFVAVEVEEEVGELEAVASLGCEVV